jgi:hypothetical protein
LSLCGSTFAGLEGEILISRKKKWPLALGASLEIAVAIAVGIVVVGAFRGWFRFEAHASTLPRQVQGQTEPRVARQADLAR